MNLNRQKQFQPSEFRLQHLLRAFGSDWAQLEPGTSRKGNLHLLGPLNNERRFMSQLQPSAFTFPPFLDAPIKGSLAQLFTSAGGWRTGIKKSPVSATLPQCHCHECL
jgi:hypothetical protein